MFTLEVVKAGTLRARVSHLRRPELHTFSHANENFMGSCMVIIRFCSDLFVVLPSVCVGNSANLHANKFDFLVSLVVALVLNSLV